MYRYDSFLYSIFCVWYNYYNEYFECDDNNSVAYGKYDWSECGRIKAKEKKMDDHVYAGVYFLVF